MSTPDLLIVFGFAWILVAATLGLLQGVRHTGHLARLDELATSGDLAAYHQEAIRYRRGVNTHTHAMLFALLTLTTALVLKALGAAGADVRAIALLAAGATVVWTAGGLLNVKAVKGAGDLFLLLAMLLTLLRAGEDLL